MVGEQLKDPGICMYDPTEEDLAKLSAQELRTSKFVKLSWLTDEKRIVSLNFQHENEIVYNSLDGVHPTSKDVSFIGQKITRVHLRSNGNFVTGLKIYGKDIGTETTSAKELLSIETQGAPPQVSHYGGGIFD